MRGRLFYNFKIYLNKPGVAASLVLLALAVLVAITIFFVAPVFYAALVSLALFGLAITSIYSQFGLANLENETKLKTNELNALINDTNDGIIIYDLDFKILDLNKSAENLLRIKKDEVLYKKITPQSISASNLKLLTQVLFPSLAPTAIQISEENWPQIVDVTTSDPVLKLRTTLNRFFDEKQKTAGFIKIVNDQTRESGILQSKNEFITITSHQLRTPLTGISWAFENLINNLNDKAELKEAAEEGAKLTHQALKTVNDLLDIAKIEEGRFGYKPEKTEISEFIAKIAGQAAPIAKEYQVSLKFDRPKENYFVNTDPQKLGIAVSNLIDNAMRYNSRNGEIFISVTKIENRPLIKISIKDTGVGIPSEEIGKLFSKFYRGSNVSQIAPNGNGLGLYITKNIIENHNGKISVESSLGRGSVFDIILPIIK